MAWTSRVEIVGAPVFGHDGEAVLEIALRGFAEPVRGADLGRVGKRLRQVCRRITESLHGRLSAGY